MRLWGDAASCGGAIPAIVVLGHVFQMNEASIFGPRIILLLAWWVDVFLCQDLLLSHIPIRHVEHGCGAEPAGLSVAGFGRSSSGRRSCSRPTWLTGLFSSLWIRRPTLASLVVSLPNVRTFSCKRKKKSVSLLFSSLALDS